MEKEYKLPCSGCNYNTFEDEKNVYCKFIQIYGNGIYPSIEKSNKIKNGLEIVPKSIFYDPDSTCAAKG